jgi:hypothetical protein
MALELTIHKGGARERSITLPEGEYSIGRKSENHVALPDKAVSGRHASLSVSGHSVRIKDLKSTNGVFHNDKRIQKMTFEGDFEVLIGPYTLCGRLPGGQGKAQTTKAKDRTLAAPSPRLMVHASLLALVLIMGMVFYLPIKGATTGFQQRETLKRGILLARYLAELNHDPLRLKDLDRVRTLPTSEEEGVVYAYIVDPYGKILAPAQEMGTFLDLPHVNDALDLAQLKVWTGDDKERIIFYPITLQDKLLGAAFLGFDPARALVESGTGAEGRGAFLFLCMLGLAAFLGWVILRVILTPLRRLAEEAGQSLKDRRDKIGAKGGYKEYKALVEAYDRMLLLVAARQPETTPVTRDDIAAQAPHPRPSPEPLDEPTSRPRPAPTPSAAPEPQAKQAFPDPPPEPPALDQPACVIDLHGYTLCSCNQAFQELFFQGEARLPGMHMLEAFSDPDLITAISSLAEDPRPEAQALVEGERTMRVVKTPAPQGQEHAALFTFEPQDAAVP